MRVVRMMFRGAMSVMFLVMMGPVLDRSEAKLIHVSPNKRAEHEASGEQE